MKDDIQEKDQRDLEEASIDLSDTESSAKAVINKQSSRPMRQQSMAKARSISAGMKHRPQLQGKSGEKSKDARWTSMGISVEVRVGEGVVGR